MEQPPRGVGMGASVMSRLCSCRMRVCRSLRVCSAEPSSSGGSLTWAGSCCQPSAEEGEQSPVWLEGQGWRLQRSRADRPLLAVRAGGDARFDATDRNRVRDVGRIESNGSSARALGLEEAQELRQRIHAARAPSRGTVIRVKGSGLTIKPPKSASGRRTLDVKGQLDLPVGGQLISLLADSLSPCPRTADLLLI
jgi:hypothetical protein